jgi:hypothetical protein
MGSPCCLCACMYIPYQFLNAGTNLMKLGMYIVASEPIWTAYFLNPSHQSVCLYVYFPVVSRQRLCKHVPAATNTRNNRRIVGPVVFGVVLVASKESLWACLCIPLSLLGNGSVNTFPRQRRIVEGVVFYAVRVVSKERRRNTSLHYTSLSFIRSSWFWGPVYLAN